MNDFQRQPARLLPFFPHNFLPQQQAVDILASRINCLSHPQKIVNRHATSPIFAAYHGRFIKFSIWLPSRVKAARRLGLLQNNERERERTLGTKKQTAWARSIQPNFPEISVQNSMDRFGPTGKVSKKRVHLLRWSSFPGRTVWNFG